MTVMRIAIPQWQGRVSPVFDVAGNLQLIDIENGQEVRREERPMAGTDPIARIGEFLSFGAGILICGAISAPMQARLVSGGVRVIGFTCGTVDDVFHVYIHEFFESRRKCHAERSWNGFGPRRPGTGPGKRPRWRTWQDGRAHGGRTGRLLRLPELW